MSSSSRLGHWLRTPNEGINQRNLKNLGLGDTPAINGNVRFGTEPFRWTCLFKIWKENQHLFFIFENMYTVRFTAILDVLNCLCDLVEDLNYWSRPKSIAFWHWSDLIFKALYFLKFTQVYSRRKHFYWADYWVLEHNWRPCKMCDSVRPQLGHTNDHIHHFHHN